MTAKILKMNQFINESSLQPAESAYEIKDKEYGIYDTQPYLSPLREIK